MMLLTGELRMVLRVSAVGGVIFNPLGERKST